MHRLPNWRHQAKSTRTKMTIPSTDTPVVVTEQLTKKYGELTALDALSIQLDPGHILGLIGPNGAGKTTAIKILVGLARPTSGSATIAGADCTRDARKIKRLVGYMPDTFGSYDNMRVQEYLDFFATAYQLPWSQRRNRIDEVLEMTGAGYMRDRYVESLSHGMKQRVAIARTLLHDPAVLILDEPANGLDPIARVEMRQILLHLADLGKTLIVTSHILPELARICNRIAIMTHGKLRAMGTLEEITRDISQQRLIEVQLADPEQLKTAEGLLQECVEEDAEVLGSAAEAALRFRTEKRDVDLGNILTHLIQNGVLVTQFRELQTDLEDAFLNVAQNTSAEDQAGGNELGSGGEQ